MPATGGLECFGHAAERKIVGLGAAAGEDNFRRLAADEYRYRRAGVVQDALGALAEVVHTRRVTEIVSERPRHRLDDGWIDWSGRVVVEVDPHGDPSS